MHSMYQTAKMRVSDLTIVIDNKDEHEVRTIIFNTRIASHPSLVWMQNEGLAKCGTRCRWTGPDIPSQPQRNHWSFWNCRTWLQTKIGLANEMKFCPDINSIFTSHASWKNLFLRFVGGRKRKSWCHMTVCLAGIFSELPGAGSHCGFMHTHFLLRLGEMLKWPILADSGFSGTPIVW